MYYGSKLLGDHSDWSTILPSPWGSATVEGLRSSHFFALARSIALKAPSLTYFVVAPSTSTSLHPSAKHLVNLTIPHHPPHCTHQVQSPPPLPPPSPPSTLVPTWTLCAATTTITTPLLHAIASTIQIIPMRLALLHPLPIPPSSNRPHDSPPSTLFIVLATAWTRSYPPSQNNAIFSSLVCAHIPEPYQRPIDLYCPGSWISPSDLLADSWFSAGRVPDYPSSQHPSSPFHSRTSSSYLDERPSSIGASFRDGTLLRASYGPSCSGLTSSATGSSHGPLAQPKPPLFGRTMALPSSSPKHEHQASAIRAPDHPEMPRRPYGDSGDGPRFPRSNASMSINSLVDSGSNPTHRPPAWSPIPEKGSQAGTPSRTRHSSPGSPSAHAYRHDGNGLSYTPRAHSNLDLSRSHDTTGFSARSRLASQTQGGDKPGKNAHDFSRLLQPFHPPSLSALGPQPPRPSSQPAGIDQDYREQTIPASRAEYYDDPSIVAYGGSSRGRAPDDFSGMRRPVHDENFRRDPVEVPYEALAEGSIVGPLPAVDIGAGEDRGPFPSQYLVPPTTTQDLRRDGYYSGDSPIEARHAYTGAFTNQQEIGDVPSSLFANPIGRFGVSPQIERKIQRTPPAVDTGLRQSIEDHRAQHRSFPGLVNNDHGRRYERGSPLPQAVQGAQSQPVGSGRDPGIKSEFGKMFSGLGSGVGSTPQPVPPSHNGTSTPGPRSPLDEVRHSEVLNRRESNQNATGGRGGRKGRRTGALDGRTGTDGTDAKLTSAALSKVPKRNRYIQPPVPHHHHHPVAFQ